MLRPLVPGTAKSAPTIFQMTRASPHKEGKTPMGANQQAEAMLAQMFTMAKAQFGNAVKSSWFHAGDACPGCGRPVGAIRHKGKQAISLNAFIHRKPGVLIGYLLCNRCVAVVMEAGKKFPPAETPLHATIETNLITAYERYRKSLDA